MKKTQLILLFCLIQTAFLFAQPSIPELKQALATATADTTRYRLLKTLGKLNERKDRDSALFYYKTRVELAEKNGAQQILASASFDVGMLYADQYLNHTEALKWLEKSTFIAEKGQDHALLALNYANVGDIMAGQRLIDEASKFYEKAEQQAELTTDKSAKQAVYSLISFYISYYKPNHNLAAKTAHEYSLKALRCADDLPETWLMIAGNLCMNYAERGQKDSIKYLHQAAMRLIKDKKLNLNDAGILSSMLRLHGEAEQYTLMEKTYQDLEARTKTPEDSAALCDDLYSVADFRAKQGNYKGAYEAHVHANELNEYAELRRYTQDARVQATKTEAVFEIAQKERETVYQKRISMAIGVGLLLALGLAYFVYRSRQQIAQQKTELEDLNKTKDRLLSIIAHDLRSPIGLLKDSFDLMDNNLRTPEKTAQFLSKSKERIERVYNTMENLLVWALAQRNGLNPRFESVSIAVVVAEQMDNVRDFAERKGITIKNDTPQYLTVWADKNQLAIVLNNLLQNALKFTPSGGTISLSVEPTSDKQLTIKIADSGVGMDIEAWQQQQRSQVLLSKEGTAKEKGTGLGLFLVKEIMDKNGGTLAIQSKKGMGTTVSVGLKKGN
jgi:signal transduction histidine kinase